MPFTFPHFDDIPNPELLEFNNISDITNYCTYCDNILSCAICPFEDPASGCAAINKKHHKHRQALLGYVKTHHPEYLL